MDEVTVEAKVAEWNETYGEMGREIAELSAEAYEAEIGNTLLIGVCDSNLELALAVFNHPNNKGGWMCGDVVAFMKNKMS